MLSLSVCLLFPYRIKLISKNNATSENPPPDSTSPLKSPPPFSRRRTETEKTAKISLLVRPTTHPSQNDDYFNSALQELSLFPVNYCFSYSCPLSHHGCIELIELSRLLSLIPHTHALQVNDQTVKKIPMIVKRGRRETVTYIYDLPSHGIRPCPPPRLSIPPAYLQLRHPPAEGSVVAAHTQVHSSHILVR